VTLGTVTPQLLVNASVRLLFLVLTTVKLQVAEEMSLIGIWWKFSANIWQSRNTTLKREKMWWKKSSN
jgi:hypothetical protein